MRLLLDTHIFLWVVADDPKLSAAARETISDAAEVFVSSASIWETSIKAGLGKLDVDIDALVSAIETSGFNELPVMAAHGAGVRILPDYHRDPFDRLLIAQAKHEPMHFMTADRHLAQYAPDLVMNV
ncbi:type II toxin-antitoxin system VapC family toxin [Paraburkholderia kururiensis]|uniref:type II toxin-antitoxin system VapC family toxin n=1 Tax=Paraburkholderia kururiensis TaxID=984307 RepID=UPI000F86E039|nr:type II toxin-antitoxin system VapC family toxin [Paraburkholderia kururiensis]